MLLCVCIESCIVDRYGPLAADFDVYSSPINYDPDYTANFLWMYIDGPLSVANQTISFEIENINSLYVVMFLKDEFTLYNVTLTDNGYGSQISLLNCQIYCDFDNTTQYIIFDGIFQQCYAYNCTFIDNPDKIPSKSIISINQITSILDEFELIYETECSDNENANDSSNSNMIFDIGYPLYGESSIVNNDYGSSICCRGSESCSYASTIFSNMGNIFCVGDFSCGDAEYVWTRDNSAFITTTTSSAVTIYCMAYAACFGSSLKSADRIICGAYYSCNNAEILRAKSLYCTREACNEAIITQTESIYLFNKQNDISIYSGGVGISHIWFNGRNSGTRVEITCDDGDVCYIDCSDDTACNNKTTMITCYGKCFISCNINGIEDNKDCVNIDLSLSPTVSPSNAPTIAPTIGPSGSPTVFPTVNPSGSPSVPPTSVPSFAPTVPPTVSSALTREDVGIWFNWIIWIILASVIIITAIGYADSRRFHKNELFRWNAILVFGVYTVDFISDAFFSMELYLFMMDDELENIQLLFIILFTLSLVFIIVPLVTNLIQLHKELSKWLVDPVLAQTEAPLWILSYVRMLYFVAVITGSSFSAVSLLNSNLFQWPMFGMGLSKFHRQMFRNKRFFSVVLLEVCLGSVFV